jgi:hypothetical protein
MANNRKRISKNLKNNDSVGTFSSTESSIVEDERDRLLRIRIAAQFKRDMKNNLQHSVSLIAMTTAGKMSKNPSLKKLTLLPTGSRPDKNLSGKNGHKP